MGGGMGGMPGMGGMGGMPGMGGYGGGMGNYNMSNAVDVRTCSTLSSGEITQQPSPTSQSPTYRGNVTDTLTSHTTNRTATPRDAAEKPYEHQIFPGNDLFHCPKYQAGCCDGQKLQVNRSAQYCELATSNHDHASCYN